MLNVYVLILIKYIHNDMYIVPLYIQQIKDD